MSNELRAVLEWSLAILTQIGLGFWAARAGLLRVKSQNRGDDATAAQIYAKLAAEQAVANDKMTKEYESKLAMQAAEYETKLADLQRRSDTRDAALRAEILQLKALVGGPYQITFLFTTHPNPEILEAHVSLMPKLSDQEKTTGEP